MSSPGFLVLGGLPRAAAAKLDAHREQHLGRWKKQSHLRHDQATWCPPWLSSTARSATPPPTPPKEKQRVGDPRHMECCQPTRRLLQLQHAQGMRGMPGRLPCHTRPKSDRSAVLPLCPSEVLAPAEMRDVGVALLEPWTCHFGQHSRKSGVGQRCGHGLYCICKTTAITPRLIMRLNQPDRTRECFLSISLDENRGLENPEFLLLQQQTDNSRVCQWW